MTTTAAHRWTIANDLDADAPVHRAGAADTYYDAWTRALAAGRAALLAGELTDLAVTVDDDPWSTAHYSPGRDEGHLDPARVTATLVEIHQTATAGVLTDQLADHQA